jgi:hypothetical protein
MRNNSVRPTGLKGNEQVNRMRSLMGMAPIHENVKRSVVELIKKGPDGRIYGIVRENHEYYIKIANNKPNLIAEDFNYIGGLKNKKEVVYESYAKAIKQLNLKFISLNEARGTKDETNTFRNDKEIIAEAFESYSEAPKSSQPDKPLGTVKSIGKNDGHDKEIITDTGETGNPDVDTPPTVKEEDVDENTEVIDEDDIVEGDEDIAEDAASLAAYREKNSKNQEWIDDKNAATSYSQKKTKEKAKANEELELTESEIAIDKMILETRDPVVEPTEKAPVVERRLSIAVALDNIDEGINSQKKK